MKASDLDRLIFTPFHTSKILHHFLSGVNTVNINSIKTELIYLVLPFIYNTDMYEKLKNLNKNSKFNAFIDNSDFDVFLSSLDDNIKDFRKITNIAIIVLSNEITLGLSEYVTIENKVHFSTEDDLHLKSIYKASYNLGLILGKERYLSVFKKLRITEL